MTAHKLFSTCSLLLSRSEQHLPHKSRVIPQVILAGTRINSYRHRDDNVFVHRSSEMSSLLPPTSRASSKSTVLGNTVFYGGVRSTSFTQWLRRNPWPTPPGENYCSIETSQKMEQRSVLEKRDCACAHARTHAHLKRRLERTLLEGMTMGQGSSSVQTKPCLPMVQTYRFKTKQKHQCWSAPLTSKGIRSSLPYSNKRVHRLRTEVWVAPNSTFQDGFISWFLVTKQRKWLSGRCGAFEEPQSQTPQSVAKRSVGRYQESSVMTTGWSRSKKTGAKLLVLLPEKLRIWWQRLSRVSADTVPELHLLSVTLLLALFT